jgi:hypothetical protein
MASIDILENGLQELKDAVNRKATPEDLMKIVHIQIHPMLQSIYDLRLVLNKVCLIYTTKFPNNTSFLLFDIHKCDCG